MRSSASLVIVIILIAILYFLGMSRAPDMLANNLSKKLDTSVSIGSIKPRPSILKIGGLEIGNAQGYSLPKAFSAKTIHLKAPLTTYFHNQVVVDEIVVDKIYLGIEFDTTSGTSGNWTQLLTHYQRAANLDAKDGRKVLIKKLVFTNIQSDLIFHSEGSKITKLPFIDRIELTNISTEGGLPMDQLTGSILGQMLKEAFLQYHLNNMLKGLILDTPGKAVETLVKPFEGIFNVAPSEKIELKHSA